MGAGCGSLRFHGTYGHEAGDWVLQSLSPVLRDKVRGSDIACRYGGEAFMLVLPESSLAETMTRAEDLRVAIAGLPVFLRGQQLGKSWAKLRHRLGWRCFPTLETIPGNSPWKQSLETVPGNSPWQQSLATVPGNSGVMLFQAADTALYQAKTAGRNPVVVAPVSEATQNAIAGTPSTSIPANDCGL